MLSLLAKLREPSPEKVPKKSTDTTSESSEINAAEYIPVHKEIIIGLPHLSQYNVYPVINYYS